MKHNLHREEIAKLPELDVAIVILRQGEDFLLQYRAEDNGATGLIGGFGGMIEDEKDGGVGLRAIVRETSEEVGVGENQETARPLELSEHEFFRQGMVHVVSDRDGEAVFINGEIFEAWLEKGLPVVALKSVLRRVRQGDLQKAKAKGELTPATEDALERYYGI